MARFSFRLEPVLKYRRSLREQVLQMLAQLLRDVENLQRQEAEAAQERQRQIDELRQIGAGGAVDIDRAATRRYHAGALTVEIQNLERNRAAVEGQVQLCRQALARVDQDVKLLEKLKEKQLAEYLHEQEKRSAREREDAWIGAHWKEFAS